MSIKPDNAWVLRQFGDKNGKVHVALEHEAPMSAAELKGRCAQLNKLAHVRPSRLRACEDASASAARRTKGRGAATRGWRGLAPQKLVKSTGHDERAELYKRFGQRCFLGDVNVKTASYPYPICAAIEVTPSPLQGRVNLAGLGSANRRAHQLISRPGHRVAAARAAALLAHLKQHPAG